MGRLLREVAKNVAATETYYHRICQCSTVHKDPPVLIGPAVATFLRISLGQWDLGR